MFYSIIFIISFIIFRYFIKNYANKIGDEKLSDNKKIFYIEFIIMLLYAIVHFILLDVISHNCFTVVMESIFFANTCLMVQMDMEYKQTYDLYHFINIASMILYIGYAGFPSNYISFLVFVGSQLFLFQFLYGQADAFLYCECAAYMFVHDAILLDYFLYMAISILLLGIVQCCRKNINRYGNLKEEVAFTPYIILAFIIFSTIKGGFK